MGLAFWRSKKRTGNAAAKPANRTPLPSDDDPDLRGDPALALRTRARHRLIGAAALLLAVAIVVPMVLDSEPPAVPENIPIEIPSERTPFSPRLALPPMPAPEATAAPPDRAPAVEGNPSPKPATKSDTGKAPAKTDEAKQARVDQAKTPPKVEDAKAAEAVRARAALEGQQADAEPAVAKSGKFAVQLAAPASENAARDLADRLKGAGFTAFVEKVETRNGARYRVRVGPYASRDDAERARDRLKTSGMTGNVVTQ